MSVQPATIVRPGRASDLSELVQLTCDLATETEHGLRLDHSKVTAGVTAGLPETAAGATALTPRYWVAERDGGSLVGFVAISPEWSDWWACTYWWVTSVYVLPSERRLGVGAALFTAMHEDADAEGVQTVNLRVERQNARAQGFYIKQGFSVDESHLVMSRGRRPDGSAISS